MQLATENTAPRTAPANALPGGAYETNFNTLLANQCREVYTQQYSFMQALSLLRVQGLTEITVKTRTGALTIPITSQQRGFDIGLELMEMLGEKLGQLESDILRYSQDSEANEPEDATGASARAQLFAFCLPMRPMSDAEFIALPPEARRAYDEVRAEQVKAA